MLGSASAAPTLRATAALALSYACAYGMHPALLQPTKTAAAAGAAAGTAGTDEAAAAGEPMAVESDAGPESKVQKTEAGSTAGAAGTADGTAAKVVYDEVADRVLELLHDKEPKVVGRAAAAAGYLAGGWGGAWAEGADGGGAGEPTAGSAKAAAAVGGRLLGGLFGLSGSKSEDVQFAGVRGSDMIYTHALRCMTGRGRRVNGTCTAPNKVLRVPLVLDSAMRMRSPKRISCVFLFHYIAVTHAVVAPRLGTYRPAVGEALAWAFGGIPLPPPGRPQHAVLATNHTTLADHFGTAALEQEEQEEGEAGADAAGAQKKEGRGEGSGGGGGSALQGAILDRLLKELVVSPKTEVRPQLQLYTSYFTSPRGNATQRGMLAASGCLATSPRAPAYTSRTAVSRSMRMMHGCWPCGLLPLGPPGPLLRCRVAGQPTRILWGGAGATGARGAAAHPGGGWRDMKVEVKVLSQGCAQHVCCTAMGLCGTGQGGLALDDSSCGMEVRERYTLAFG